MKTLSTVVELEKRDKEKKFMTLFLPTWLITNTKIIVLNKKSTSSKEEYLIMFQELVTHLLMTE